MESTKTVKEKEQKQPMTPKQKTFFVLKIVGNIVFYSVIIALFLFSIMNINAGNKRGIPNLFGKGYLSVLTNSMDGKESMLPEEYKDYSVKSFKSGDLVHIDLIDKSYVNNLKVGDVVTFWDDSITLTDGSKGAFNTHRITYMKRDTNNNVYLFYTVGDLYVSLNGDQGAKKIDAMTPAEIMDYENLDYVNVFSETNFNNIKGKVTGIWVGGGNVMQTIQNNWLFIFVIPICIVLIIEVILVVKNILDLRREKNKAIDLADHEAQMAELQNEKERMRQELLAELRAQGAIQDEPKPAEEPKVEETPVSVAAEESPVEEAKVEAKEETATEEKAEEPAEEPVEEKTDETVEETPAEDKNEEVVEETTKEEVNETPASESEEEVKEEKEEPVVNEEEVEEPNLDIEENEEVEEKPAKKATTKKSTGTKKSSTTKK